MIARDIAGILCVWLSHADRLPRTRELYSAKKTKTIRAAVAILRYLTQKT
jgi:hypothetical protein